MTTHGQVQAQAQDQAQQAQAQALQVGEISCRQLLSQDEASSVICEFRVATNTNANANDPSSLVELKYCPNDSNGNGICVHANINVVISSPPDEQKQQQTKEEHEHEHEPAAAAAAAADATTANRRILKVGKATYRPPYSQYGSRVEIVLQRAPSSSITSSEEEYNNNEWASWYWELGDAHFPAGFDDDQGNLATSTEWYDLELAVNAFEQAIDKVKLVLQGQIPIPVSTTSTTTTTTTATTEQQQQQQQQYDFMAIVYFQMGEAYFMDPEQSHTAEALESFLASQKIMVQNYKYLSLLHQRHHRTDINNIQQQQKLQYETYKRYAEVCTKVGMAIMSVMDPMEQQPEWMSGIMDAFSANLEGSSNLNYENEDLDGGTQNGNGNGNANNNNNNNKYSLEDAQKEFQKSIQIYQTFLDGDYYIYDYDENDDSENENEINRRERRLRLDRWEMHLLQIGHAQALQYAASATGMMGDLASAREYFESALRLHLEDLLPSFGLEQPPHDDRQAQDRFNSMTTVADLYMSLADMCLQLGDYPKAKTAYTEAMDWHEQHNIEVAPMHSIMEDEEQDEALQDYVSALQEYRQMVKGANKKATASGTTNSHGHGRNTKPIYPQGTLNDDQQGGNVYYERDDGYEGDMLASLGAIYLSRGETDRAIAYLEQAWQLYYKTPSDRRSRQMADVQINLSMAYYRGYKFAASSVTQLEAYDIYLELYGPGVNPYAQGLEEYEEMITQAMGVDGVGTSGGNRQHQHQHQPPQDEITKSEDNQDANTAPRHHMIDLEQYKQSIKNATEALPQVVKEEL